LVHQERNPVLAALLSRPQMDTNLSGTSHT
jgi:hypothetical protein